MRKCKKLLLSIFCLALVLVVAGCETEVKFEAAHISDITSDQSTSYAVKVMVDQDDRVDDKYVDLQIKSSKPEQLVTMYKERNEPVTICFAKSDFWYNLTYLVSRANGVAHDGGYLTAEDFGSKVLNFHADNEVELTFRVVAGDKKENSDNGEEILVLSQPISKEVKIKLKKYDEKK